MASWGRTMKYNEQESDSVNMMCLCRFSPCAFRLSYRQRTRRQGAFRSIFSPDGAARAVCNICLWSSLKLTEEAEEILDAVAQPVVP